MALLSESLAAGDTGHLSDHLHVHNKLNGVVDVKADFSASGDGTTDDTSAIHAARDASGSELFFPDGTYLTTGLTANVPDQIWRLAPGATIKLAPSASSSALTVSADRVTVRGGEIDGNRTAQSSSVSCISASGAGDFCVEGVRIVDAKYYGIQVANCAGGRIIGNKVIDSGNIGIFVEASGAGDDFVGPLISDNTVDRSALGSGLSEGGIKIHSVVGGREVERCRVVGNLVVMPSSPTDGTAICIEVWSPSSVVSDNITSGGEMGISIAGWGFVTVTGNTVFDSDLYGIEVAGNNGSDYTAVCNNTIDANANGTRGILVNSASTHVSVTGNVIKNSTTRAIEAAGDFVSISGNEVDIAAGQGVYLSGDHATITANSLMGNGTATKAVTLDTSSSVVLVGNICEDFTEHGVLLFASTAVTLNRISITGNTFDNCNVAYGTQLSGGATLGSLVTAVGNNGFTTPRFGLDLLNSVQVYTGAGSPEGAQAAGVGSLFLRNDGGTGTTLYVKESGTGNTGWAAK